MKLVPASAEMAPQIDRIFQHSPRYFHAISGQSAKPEASMLTLKELPPGCGPHQKNVFLIEWQNRFIGVSDLVFGYPDSMTAFLGLLVIDESYQGQDLGREAYFLLEQFVRQSKFHKIRLAVVETNPVKLFWEKLGFKEIGITKPYENHSVVSRVFVMEKHLEK